MVGGRGIVTVQELDNVIEHSRECLDSNSNSVTANFVSDFWGASCAEKMLFETLSIRDNMNL